MVCEEEQTFRLLVEPPHVAQPDRAGLAHCNTAPMPQSAGAQGLRADRLVRFGILEYTYLATIIPGAKGSPSKPLVRRWSYTVGRRRLLLISA